MQVTLDREHHRRAAEKAAQLGLSLAEYIRRVVAADLDPSGTADGDISEIFGIGDSGGSDVAIHKDRYLAEALAAEHVSAPRPG
ncbi:MAG: hypothetical protein L0H84_03650 [Pseudonocardia sp.]|nr:hypothetical protein [Pseudonocardia sp.]